MLMRARPMGQKCYIAAAAITHSNDDGDENKFSWHACIKKELKLLFRCQLLALGECVKQRRYCLCHLFVL